MIVNVITKTQQNKVVFDDVTSRQF